MIAYVKINKVQYELMHIAENEMDEVEKNNERLVGIPCFFTTSARVWPKPERGLKVVFKK